MSLTFGYSFPASAKPISSKEILKQAHTKLENQQNQEALFSINAVIAKEPGNAQAHVERGHAYIHLHQYQKSLTEISKALEISPRLAEAYLLRALAYEKLGNFQKEIADLTAALKIDPKDAATYLERGQLFGRIGRLQDAISDCLRAKDLNPKDSDAYEYAGGVYYELGKYNEAIKLQTRAIGLSDKNASTFDSRADSYERLGKTALAGADRMKASTIASPTEFMILQTNNPLVDFKNASIDISSDIINKQLKDKPVVLPFLFDESRHISIPATINGHLLRLMLDTGSANSDLWKQAMPGIATASGVPQQGADAHGRKYSFGFFRAKDLKIGELIFKNVAMDVDEGLVGHKTISGFLGGNLLQNFVVTVDYGNKSVTFANSYEKKNSAQIICVPMILRGHQPLCKVRLDNKLEVLALLDTGSPFSMSADALIAPILDKKLLFKSSISGPWLGNLNAESVKVKSLDFGTCNLIPPIFDVFPAAEAPRVANEITLGDDFLSSFKSVTFDYPGRRILFELDKAGGVSAASAYKTGQYYLTNHQDRQAVESFSQAMSLDVKHDFRCYIYRAEAYENLKQYKKALADWDQAMLLDRVYIKGYLYHRGKDFFYLKQYPQAITACDEMIKLDPRNAWHYFHRGYIRGLLKQYRLAIDDDTEAIRHDPTLKPAIHHREWLYGQLGKWKVTALEEVRW